MTLDVISVNFWQIVISLLNLTIMFLILKKFLFKPVKNMIAKRQSEVDAQYENAASAEKNAMESKAMWEEKLASAKDEADTIIKSASESAARRGDEIVAEAKDKAEGILRQAQNQAELEKKKAYDSIKKDIADVSTLLSEKMLEREIKTDDHRKLIDSFINNIGDGDDGNK
ncbi:MAG: F0F1 ATP synthase subunit B [Clostridia bacterium]|nr:F0F1 ATP synthase subunit B [Clostridia bacterium]